MKKHYKMSFMPDWLINLFLIAFWGAILFGFLRWLFSEITTLNF